MTPLAITGMGAVTQGVSGRAALESLLRVCSVGAFAPPSLFDAASWPGLRVLEATDFDATRVLGDKGLRNIDRLTRFFLVAARQCLEDSGLKSSGTWTTPMSGSRAGVCASTAYGSLESMVELHRVALLESPRYLNPAKFPNTVINAALGYVSIWEDLRAINATVCNGNCGALDAVLLAETFLAGERADVVVVGGAEAMHEGLCLAFHRLDAMSGESDVFAPSDLARSRGMRLGEGAVMLTLEREDHAIARGKTSCAVVTGFGTAFEPPVSEAILVHLSAEALARAIRSSLSDASLTPADIDVVISSANGYAPYDRAESEAISSVFERSMPLALAKRVVGETLGAGGAFGLAMAAMVVEGVRPEAVAGALWPSQVRRALVLSTGFYGNATAVIVESR